MSDFRYLSLIHGDEIFQLANFSALQIGASAQQLRQKERLFLGVCVLVDRDFVHGPPRLVQRLNELEHQNLNQD
jgi:hypothetical protein